MLKTFVSWLQKSPLRWTELLIPLLLCTPSPVAPSLLSLSPNLAELPSKTILRGALQKTEGEAACHETMISSPASSPSFIALAFYLLKTSPLD